MTLVPLQGPAPSAGEALTDMRIERNVHGRIHGEDLPEVRGWRRPPAAGPGAQTVDAERDAPEG